MCRKLYRKIALELSMPKYRRGRCFEFMLACRTEYDRLVSTNLQPPGFVIKRYKKQFKSVAHKPEVVNVGLEQVHVAHDPPDQPPEEIGTEGLPITRVHPHGRRHRARRASTVLQDSIIDPGKAMQNGLGSQPSVELAVVQTQPVVNQTDTQNFTSGIATPFAAPAKGPRGLMDNRLASIPDEQ